MFISPLMLLLMLLIVLVFSGWGYGYYNQGAYATPIGLLGVVLVVALVVMLLMGWTFTATPPP